MIRGQYQLLEKIGAGGMGEVYQARDTKLNRLVAIKILRGDGAGDQSRQRRFIQEAQAASALNHPNIITIYDIVSENGSEIMVMEYVAGKTLDHLIPKGGMRLPVVLHYAQQMADALRTAHAAGIIHRDLKPANIMVTEQERVKILDFGLAKFNFASEAAPADDPEATQLAPLTVAGTIMGTICYMSPEQAQGKPVDARSDVFSFGAVLYEMATGERAFLGDNMATMLSAVLRDEPRRIMELSPAMPEELDEVIRLCLAKDVEARWKSMDVVYQVLTRLKQVSDSGQPFKSQLASGISRPAPSMMSQATPPGASTSTVNLPPPPSSGSGIPLGIAAVPLGGKKLKLSKRGWLLVGVLAMFGATCWNRNERNVKVVATDPSKTPIVDINLDADPQEEVDNDTVIKLVKAKASPALIIRQIRNAESTDFDLSTDAVLKLVKAGVPEEVIEVMRNPKAPPPPPTPGAGVPPSPVGPPAGAEKKGPPPPLAPEKTAVVQAREVVIPDGLPLLLKLDQDVPIAAEEGLVLKFTVAEDLKIGEDVVIPKGAAATGGIVLERRRGAKIFGGGQRLAFRLNDVIGVEGKPLRIRNTPSQRGTEAPARPLEVLQRKGMAKELAAMKDTPFPAYVAGEQTVRVAGAPKR
jgi:serine/threonine protein kinase